MSIGLAILTMNRPKILERTLESYKQANFLNLFDETIILLQTNNSLERRIAERYGLTIYSTNKNIGIGPGNNFLIDKLTTDYFVICQNDFKLVNTDFSQISNAIKMIENGVINCYRLRSLVNPGQPSWGSSHLIKPHGPLSNTHACCMLFYKFLKDPHLDPRFENIFKFDENNNCHILSSRHACYTENPCIYNKQWYIDNIYKFNLKADRGAELNVQKFWEQQNYNVGIGDGLFCHDDSNK